MRRSHGALVAVLTVLLTTLWVAPAKAATSTCSEQGNYEVCVTYGGAGNADTLIPRKLKAKIDAAADAVQSGDYIRVALYDWQTDGYGGEVADALVRARQLGVSVRVVVGTIAASIETKFVNAGIDLRKCDKACMRHPDGQMRGAMHNKFFVIKTGATTLVMQTSMNMRRSQEQHAQNLLIVRNDGELFSGYVDYWRRLYAESWTWGGVTWSDDDKSPFGSNDNSRAYFYPQYGKRPLVGVLAGVTECEPGNDRIWLQASGVDDSSYARDVAAQLNRLRNIGCDVKVIVQTQSSRTNLLSFGVASGDLSCDGYHHNKLTLIDAKYAGQWRKAVFVGSYNLTENSNHRANDAMLRIINGWVTNRYIDQFRAQWTNPRACDAA